MAAAQPFTKVWTVAILTKRGQPVFQGVPYRPLMSL